MLRINEWPLDSVTQKKVIDMWPITVDWCLANDLTSALN